eukprot:scaffold36324_cov141-Isochrysis_galbana.AAC.2
MTNGDITTLAQAAALELDAREGNGGERDGYRRERGRGSIAVGNLASRAREAVDPAAWEVRVDRARPGQHPSPLNVALPGAKECPQAPLDDAGRETPERKGLGKSQVGCESQALCASSG